MKLWSAQSISLLGIQFGRLALPLVAIVTLDASPAQVGLLMAAGPLPWLLLGLSAGIVVDRMRRRQVLICVHVGRAALLASVPLAAVLDILTMSQLYVVALGVGVFDVCFGIAYRAYLPSLVESDGLADGNAKLAATDGITRTAGPSLAGLTVQVLTAPMALIVQSVSFLVAGVCVWRIRRPEPAPAAERRAAAWRSLPRGLVFVWRQSILRAFTLADATYSFFYSVAYAVLLVFFTRNLQISPSVIGLIFTVGSLGGVLAALVAPRIGRRLTPGRATIGGSALRGAGIALLPLAAVAGPFALPILIAARLVNAFGWTLWEVHQETTQQLLIPHRLRGRVNSSVLFVVVGVEALGSLAGAGLAATLGVTTTLVIGAVGAGLGTLWLATSHLWSLRAYPTPADDAYVTAENPATAT